MATWIDIKTFDENSAYNAVDINRENNNLQVVKDLLLSYGFPAITPKPIKANYTRTSFPTVSAINDVRTNINSIIGGFYPVNAPIIVINPTRKQKFDFNEANKLELNLEAMRVLLDAIKDSFRYCGTFSCGEDGLI